jgi:hypothetical protein
MGYIHAHQGSQTLFLHDMHCSFRVWLCMDAPFVAPRLYLSWQGTKFKIQRKITAVVLFLVWKMQILYYLGPEYGLTLAPQSRSNCSVLGPKSKATAVASSSSSGRVIGCWSVLTRKQLVRPLLVDCRKSGQPLANTTLGDFQFRKN